MSEGAWRNGEFVLFSTVEKQLAQCKENFYQQNEDLQFQIARVEQLEKLRDAMLDCNGVEMRDCYEVPKDQWEALIALAVGSVMDKASNWK